MTALIALVAIVTNSVAVVVYFIFLDVGQFVREFAEFLERSKPLTQECLHACCRFVINSALS